jgi:ABC-type dipeptide/oligopeptide/nickel transport system permease component
VINYIIRRLFQAVLVIVGITTITFFLLRLIPGDPCKPLFRQEIPKAAYEQCRQSLGLNDSIPVQYFKYLSRVAQGDLGDSLYLKRPAMDVFMERFPATFFLAVYSIVIATLISLPLGIFAALHKNSLFDHFVRWFTTLTLSMPTFWLALIFMLFFSIRLKLFPISGYGDNFFQHLYYLFMPSLTISAGIITYLTRSLRNSILEILQSDYIRTARAKGLTNSIIAYRYMLRNGLISFITILGLALAGLVGGSVIIETIFSVPGIGALLIKSISQRDYGLIQNSTLVYALLVQVINIGIDLIYPILDPRVTLNG